MAAVWRNPQRFATIVLMLALAKARHHYTASGEPDESSASSTTTAEGGQQPPAGGVTSAPGGSGRPHTDEQPQKPMTTRYAAERLTGTGRMFSTGRELPALTDERDKSAKPGGFQNIETHPLPYRRDVPYRHVVRAPLNLSALKANRSAEAEQDRARSRAVKETTNTRPMDTLPTRSRARSLGAPRRARLPLRDFDPYQVRLIDSTDRVEVVPRMNPVLPDARPTPVFARKLVMMPRIIVPEYVSYAPAPRRVYTQTLV